LSAPPQTWSHLRRTSSNQAGQNKKNKKKHFAAKKERKKRIMGKKTNSAEKPKNFINSVLRSFHALFCFFFLFFSGEKKKTNESIFEHQKKYGKNVIFPSFCPPNSQFLGFRV
jgi:hypothetical protein